MKGFPIEVKNNLLDPKHKKKMGSSVWEYMWFLDKMTSVSEEGVGKVLGGRPIKIDEIIDEIGGARSTISENVSRLEKEGYINVVRAPYGLIITVNKAWKRFRKQGVSGKRDLGNSDRGFGKANESSEKPKSNKTVSVTDTKTDPLLHASHVEEKKECEMHSFIFPGGPCRNCPVIQNKLPEKKAGGFKRMFEK